MYTLLRSLSLQRLWAVQFPILVVSLAIAEAFYTFHSFTLECVAFLATWCVLDALVQFGTDKFLQKSKH